MFLVFYTVKIVYICVCMTCSTSYCLYNTLMDPWYVCICVSMYVCVCVYVSDFAISEGVVAMSKKQPVKKSIFEVSIKIFVFHVQVIIY